MGLKLTGGLLLLTVAASGYDKIFSRPWLDANAPIAVRVAALLDAMTLTEKVPFPTTLQDFHGLLILKALQPFLSFFFFNYLNGLLRNNTILR